MKRFDRYLTTILYKCSQNPPIASCYIRHDYQLEEKISLREYSLIIGKRKWQASREQTTKFGLISFRHLWEQFRHANFAVANQYNYFQNRINILWCLARRYQRLNCVKYHCKIWVKKFVIVYVCICACMFCVQVMYCVCMYHFCFI